MTKFPQIGLWLDWTIIGFYFKISNYFLILLKMPKKVRKKRRAESRSLERISTPPSTGEKLSQNI